MHDRKTRKRRNGWATTCLTVLALAMPGAALHAQQSGRAEAPDRPSSSVSRRIDIDEYLVRGNTVLDAPSIERAVMPYLGPDRTMQDIEAARDALLAAYRAKGYQSVYVDIPEQQIDDGVVLLQVTEIKVGRLRVVDARYTSPVSLREQVPALAEGAVPNFVEAQVELTALNRRGTRQVLPLVKQGTLPGTMDVDLKVDDQRPWHVGIGLNNDRSPQTEALRATASLGHDNLWQLDHRASLTYFGTPQDPGQTRVWSGAYLAPLPGSNWSLELSGYVSDSNVASVHGSTVLGRGHSIGLKATYTIPDAGSWWHALSVGIDFKDNDESLRFGDATDDVPLRYAPLTLSYSGYLQDERSRYGFGLSLITGVRSVLGYGSDWSSFDYKRYKASPSFSYLKTDLDAAWDLAGPWQLGLRLGAQMTDSPLVSSEQMIAGGLYSVRGYLSAEATGDVGVVGSLELGVRPMALLPSWL
ncbi:MAG: hypothetical protein DIU71_11115, partial [Proteobacteria bacterium]